MIQRAHAAPGKQHPEQPGHTGQHQAFGDELPNQPKAAGAHGQSGAEFASARYRPSQQQRSHIGAGNQQQHQHGRLQTP